MQKAPKDFFPGAFDFVNGMPARSSHAMHLDRYTAWMASVWRHAVPGVIGHVLAAGTTYNYRVWLPPYTETLGFAIHASGAGTATLTCSDDTFNSVIEIEASKNNTLADAVWTWVLEPIDGVVGNGEWRAFDITDQSSPHVVGCTVALTNDATVNLQVHQLLWFPLPRTQGSDMPA